MEQQKVLIVIVSVALFVAAVIGIGLIFFYPRTEVSPDAPLRIVQEPGAESRQQFDPIEYLRRPEAEAPDFAPRDPEDDEDFIIVFDDEDPPAPRAPAEPRPEPAPEPAPREPEPRAPEPALREPAPRAPAEPPAEPKPAPPRQPETRQVRVTEYWIQVIASPSRDRVEQARTALEERGLRGRITTRTVNDTVFYRLRVGGYSDKAEAEKFLGWIREIDGFDQSYISEEYPVRTVSR
ncbi:MAG: SPOR domain-containing protein [Spirochaetaceae bacterium]|nr:MAG: SPOR domain-containing protein [Spirochaetaceae bacterium]